MLPLEHVQEQQAAEEDARAAPLPAIEGNASMAQAAAEDADDL